MAGIDRWVDDLRRPRWKFWVSREAAARGIAGLGEAGAGAVPALMDCLYDIGRRTSASDVLDPVVRGPFGDALVAVGAASVPPLVTLLSTSLQGLGYMAVEILARHGATAVPFLAKALEDPKSAARKNAAWALERIGPAAAPAVPALIRALEEILPEHMEVIRPGPGGAPIVTEARWENTEREILELAAMSRGTEPPSQLGQREWLALAYMAALRAAGAPPSAAEVLVRTLIAGKDDFLVRGAAERLLREVTGKDFQSDTAAWRRWLKEQEAP